MLPMHIKLCMFQKFTALEAKYLKVLFLTF